MATIVTSTRRGPRALVQLAAALVALVLVRNEGVLLGLAIAVVLGAVALRRRDHRGTLATGALVVAAARLRVPQNVACASLSVVDPDSRLTGIRPNLTMVGIKAVSLLITQLKSGERGVPEFASTTYVQSFWQDGPSAPPKI